MSSYTSPEMIKYFEEKGWIKGDDYGKEHKDYPGVEIFYYVQTRYTIAIICNRANISLFFDEWEQVGVVYNRLIAILEILK